MLIKFKKNIINSKIRFKNDKPLASEGKLKLETRMKAIHSISFESASSLDVGRYTIKVKNDSGEATEHFDLIIQSIFLIKIVVFIL